MESLDHEGLDEALGDASSVLYLAPRLASGTEEGCVDLLGMGTDEVPDVLFVSYAGTPTSRLRRWRSETGDAANVRVIRVGEESSATPDDASAVVETVSNPNDLTGLGIDVAETLRTWDGDRATHVCFDSLTALLQYVDTETAYEFVHVLAGRLYAAGATAHFHADPGAHDERTVALFTSLCDAVVEIDGATTSVRTR